MEVFVILAKREQDVSTMAGYHSSSRPDHMAELIHSENIA